MTAPLFASLRSISGVIDAIGLPVVVLDASGTVVETNRAWRVHARLTDGFEARVTDGSSYLRICERAAAEGAEDALVVATGLREILAGTRDLLEIEYPSQSSTEERWVRLRAVVAPTESGLGAVLVHQDITARKRLEEVVGGFANHDPMTGLLDDGAIADHVGERLLEARRNGGRVGLTIVGVLGLDEVRDQVGGPAVDQLLIQLSGRIRRAVRGGDALCRSGSDRFTLISKGLGPNGFDALTDRLRSILAEPYDVSGQQVSVGVVVAGIISDPASSASTFIAQGLARFEAAWEEADPQLDVPDGTAAPDRPPPGGVLVAFPGVASDDDLDVLDELDVAEAEADRATAEERADAAVASLPDPALREQARIDRMVITALAAGTVAVRYRPVVRLHDRMVIGAEAEPVLPDDPGIEPEAVIAAARRTDAAGQLGLAVVRAAIADGARWQQQLPERQLATVAHISPELFADAGLTERLAALIDEVGLAPSRVTLVVAAEAIVRDPDGGKRQLARLTMAGMRVCIDDFGRTPFSMLELSQLPVDTVRVHLPSLSRGTHGGGEVTVVAAVLAAADALGLRVVASGLDGEDLVRELRRLGCSYGQGSIWPLAPDGAGLLGLAQAGSMGEGRPAGSSADRRSPAGPSRASDPAQPAHPARFGPATGAAEEMDLVFRAIVHEIRTPLTVAMGYASLLELSIDPQSAKAARSIRRAAERINHQLGSLEDVRMIDQGTLNLEMRDLDLRALVTDVVDELRDVMGINAVVREPGPEQPTVVPVVVDELRIGQVITNLVTNAAKYTSRGTPVEVRLWVDDGWAEVAVVDDGPGVPVADVGLVFRKYGRADSSRPGSGLGLYLARGTARAHGGDVTYRRRNLRPGSAFTLRLPLPPADR